MNALDLTVFGLYVLGLLAMGSVFIKRMKTSGDMFAAGGQSPWWLSGLSAFMTMFSAGTFVVWGGIAYQFGMVAVAICMCYGVAAMLAGWFLAGLWKKLGVQSAAEFLELRFGNSLVQFYIWLQGTIGIFGMGGSVYALSVLICTLVPLPPDHFLADSETGYLSVTIMSLLICAVVIVITLGGGLWAVLITDMMQFIILSVAVVVVVPLLFAKTGGVTGFVEQAPDGFFLPVANDFTWWFLAGWVAVHFFKIGAEWAFVQRYVCVPSPRDARKSTYLFGALYLISPIFWMLPPMLYRTVNADANPEQAYILACQLVLPAGMMGLMIAAMSSATASMVTTFLNVFAGAFTSEVYKRFLRPVATEKELIAAGRWITLLLGGLVVAGALLIPALGTYTGYVLTTAAIFSGPLMLPTIWGLFSKRIGLGTAWLATAGGIVVAFAVKFGFGAGGWFEAWTWLAPVVELVQANARVTDLVVGSFVPLIILAVAELMERKVHPGWVRVSTKQASQLGVPELKASTLPALMCGWGVTAVAFIMAVLALINRGDVVILGGFAAVLAAIGGLILFASGRDSSADTIRMGGSEP